MKNKFTSFFSSGLWIIVLLAVTTVGLAFKEIIIPLANGDFTHTIGDGAHVGSYDFNLHPLLINRKLLVASGNSKDGLNALTRPHLLTSAQVRSINDARRDAGGFIQGPDRVVGVVIHGQARAYPLPMMNWHEICNDRLGGQAIAVIWDGFCDTALVVSRRVDGQTLRFGYSGLVYNGNDLIYDRQPNVADESLFTLMRLAIGCSYPYCLHARKKQREEDLFSLAKLPQKSTLDAISYDLLLLVTVTVSTI